MPCAPAAPKAPAISTAWPCPWAMGIICPELIAIGMPCGCHAPVCAIAAAFMKFPCETVELLWLPTMELSSSIVCCGKTSVGRCHESTSRSNARFKLSSARGYTSRNNCENTSAHLQNKRYFFLFFFFLLLLWSFRHRDHNSYASFHAEPSFYSIRKGSPVRGKAQAPSFSLCIA